MSSPHAFHMSSDEDEGDVEEGAIPPRQHFEA